MAAEQEERHKIVTDKCNETIATLPKAKGWLFEHVFHFNGFWMSPQGVKGAIFIQDQPFGINLQISSSTWTRALIFAIINRTSFAFDSHPLLTNSPQDLVPFLGVFLPRKESIPLLETMPSPRLFWTHLPTSFFPSYVLSSPSPFVYICRDPKDVYICRDPKDVLVSLWHFVKSARSKELPPISLQEAFRLFCDGASPYGPFWDHVLEFWKASLEMQEKVLFLKYDMKRAPLVHVKRLAEFLGKPFSMQEESEGAVEEIGLCSFENLSNLEVNKTDGSSTNIVKNFHFFRKGEVGDWKNHLTPNMAARIDQITKEKLHPFGLSFSESQNEI